MRGLTRGHGRQQHLKTERRRFMILRDTLGLPIIPGREGPFVERERETGKISVIINGHNVF